jgi:nucleotide-binding universal stress UspA family protein
MIDSLATSVQAESSRRYLVCVDGRKECRVALRLACMKVQARTGHITLLHVVPPVDFQTLGSIADRMRIERLQEGEALLASLSVEAQETFGITPTLLLLEGSAGDKIVETAMNDPNIIILVLGITQHQHTGIGKLSAWLASQLNGTLLIPILMVPGNLTDQQLSTLV